jgi:hypothetical protein
MSIISDLIAKLAKKNAPAPEVEAVADALRRLVGNEDFQIFRAIIRCYAADCASALTTCPNGSVNIIRGQMGAYERIYELTGKSGADKLLSEKAQQEEFVQLVSAGIDEQKVF